LPISLSYHASGIKVAEPASWVGLGWVLNAGGVITRTIKGAPDEGSKNAGPGPKGYYKDSGLSKFSKLDIVSKTNLSPQINKTIDSMMDKHSIDAEPDIYTFNVEGMVGKFIFDEYRHPKFLSGSDVKINVDYNGTDFQRWTITTTNGTKYIFGENGAKESNSIYGSTDADNNAPTAWYLTKIIYPGGTDTLNFDYKSDNNFYFGLTSEFTTAQDSATLFNKVPDGNYIQYVVNSVIPSTIGSKNIQIEFNYNYSRADLFAYSLRTIIIKNRITGAPIDQVQFNYDYFTSTTDGSPELGTTDVMDTKRLKLISVQKGVFTSPIQLPPYTFEYYEDVALPRRCSYDVDHWGYANDNGKHNNRFTPNTKTAFKTYGLTVTPPTGGQYREPRWPNTQAGTLKKITDPLGVNTIFTFEPNQITTDTIGGGIRIKTITVNDPISKQQYIRRFDYSLSSTRSSGIIFRKPSYWTPILNEYHIIGTIFTGYKYAGDNVSDYDLSTGLFCKYSQSPLPLKDYQGYAVGYTRVKEYFSSDSSNGYKIYTYQAKSKPTVTTRLQASNYISSGVPNGKWNDIVPENLSYADPNKRGKLYPFEPLQTDLYNGLLTKQETYNQNGKLLQSTTYTYADSYTENNWFRGFVADRIAYSDGGNAYPFAYYKYRIGKVQLLSQQTTVLDSITGKSSTTIMQYAYESPNHQQATRQMVINATGDTLETVMRYSFDFDSTAMGGVITEMKKQNILTPLRIEAWKNNTVAHCATTEYAKKTIAGKISVVPIKTYALENKQLLSAVDVGFNKLFSAHITSLNGSSTLMKQQSFYRYDTMGLLQQQGKIGDVPTSYIYDYNNTRMIATASNANPEDIAYTSFEADGVGGWTMGSTYRNSTTSVTGTKSYDLSKGNIQKTGLDNSKTYWITYWAKTLAGVSATGTVQTIQGVTKNGWILWKKKISGVPSVTISGTGVIDELRLYPEGAQMINYTYIPGIGISSKSNAENIVFYEYDEANRLRTIRDADKNIVQQYCYNTAGKPISCDGTVFKNVTVRAPFKRNDCSTSYVGSTVTYTIPQGKYTSIISQADADNQAQTDLWCNGQNYANTNGTCTTTYVRLSYENKDTVFESRISADIVARFYQDIACTIPVTVNNLSINYHIQSFCKGSPSPVTVSDNLYLTCNGTYTYIKKGALIYQKSSRDLPRITSIVGTECYYYYLLNPGNGYTVR